MINILTSIYISISDEKKIFPEFYYLFHTNIILPFHIQIILTVNLKLFIVHKKSTMDKEELITSSVANEELNEICEECNSICYAKRFQKNFKNWTSGNNDIDKFIQDTQLSVHDDDNTEKALEWIPYGRFYNIK